MDAMASGRMKIEISWTAHSDKHVVRKCSVCARWDFVCLRSEFALDLLLFGHVWRGGGCVSKCCCASPTRKHITHICIHIIICFVMCISISLISVSTSTNTDRSGQCV